MSSGPKLFHIDLVAGHCIAHRLSALTDILVDHSLDHIRALGNDSPRQVPLISILPSSNGPSVVLRAP